MMMLHEKFWSSSLKSRVYITEKKND